MDYPSYLNAYNNGVLEKVVETIWQGLSSCQLCPRMCKVNRLEDRKGFCQTGLKARVYSFFPHSGEEPPISGWMGSGTIFFSGCNMRCLYCQNYEFSQNELGEQVTPQELAKIMLFLQKQGCHNINLVTPTHVLPQILKAIYLAIPQGLNLPIVYNTSGYDRYEIIKLLEGIVDIYLPDMRYADRELSLKYSQAQDYPYYNMAAVEQMYRQVGVAQMDEYGLVKKGLIIRHLVLPNGISGTEKIMQFISQRLSKETHISLMSQYLPCYKASQFKELSRRISLQEYEAAQDIMARNGLNNAWIQDGHGLKRLAGVNIRPVAKEGISNC